MHETKYEDILPQEQYDRRVRYMYKVAEQHAELPQGESLSVFISWLDTAELGTQHQAMRLKARALAMSAYLMGGQTVREAREELMTSLEVGQTCPCCGQLAKRYKRKLNSGMARILIWLEEYQRKGGDRWVKVADVAPTHVRRSNEISRLRCWGLVTEANKDEEQDSRTSGLYRISEQGRLFVQGKIRVPSHVYIYSNQVVGLSENTTSISEALGEQFSYRELMEDSL